MAISDEHLKAIGSVAVEFGSLEWLMDNLMVFLVNGSKLFIPDWEIGEIVCSRTDSLQKRLEIVSDIVEHKYANTKYPGLWKQLVAEMKPLQRERNRLLHAAWLAQNEDKPEVLTLIARKRGEKATDFSVSEVTDVAERIRKVNQRLMIFLITLGQIAANSELPPGKISEPKEKK